MADPLSNPVPRSDAPGPTTPINRKRGGSVRRSRPYDDGEGKFGLPRRSQDASIAVPLQDQMPPAQVKASVEGGAYDHDPDILSGGSTPS